MVVFVSLTEYLDTGFVIEFGKNLPEILENF